MKEQKPEALALLRKIANSEMTDEYLKNVAASSLIWKATKSNNFLHWIEKTWLPLYQVNFLIYTCYGDYILFVTNYCLLFVRNIAYTKTPRIV